MKERLNLPPGGSSFTGVTYSSLVMSQPDPGVGFLRGLPKARLGAVSLQPQGILAKHVSLPGALDHLYNLLEMAFMEGLSQVIWAVE